MHDPTGCSIPSVFYTYHAGTIKQTKSWIAMLTQIQTLLHWETNERVRTPYMKGLAVMYQPPRKTKGKGNKDVKANRNRKPTREETRTRDEDRKDQLRKDKDWLEENKPTLHKKHLIAYQTRLDLFETPSNEDEGRTAPPRKRKALPTEAPQKKTPAKKTRVSAKRASAKKRLAALTDMSHLPKGIIHVPDNDSDEGI